MRDYNICENCDEFHELDVRECGTCGQPLVLDARGSISVWRLGDIEDGTVGPVLKGIREAFGRKVVLQPAYVREEPSAREREGWKGNSANVFLRQIDERQKLSKGAFLSLGITEKNIVYSSEYNFLFGLATEGAAVMGLEPLRDGDPDPDELAQRAVQIAVHELGHGLGLDHHGYDDGIECVMIGDEAIDDVEGVDEGTSEFCKSCAKEIGIAG